MKNLLRLIGIKSLPIRRGNTSMKAVSLTFDDGPDPIFTPYILDVLKKTGVTATFFLVGQKARQHPEIVKRTVADNHEIGNHTYSHCHPYLISSSKVRDEVRRGKDVIESIIHGNIRFFRPPHGAIRLCALKEACWLNQDTVLWSIKGHDWGDRRANFNAIEKQIVNRLHSGGIILLHDAVSKINRPDETLKALPSIIQNIQHKGYEIVSLSELLKEA